MSFQLYGDNRKENIETDVTFEEGDYLIADPGVEECSARLFYMRTNQEGLISGSPLEDVFQLDKVPSFGSNKYAYPFISGVNYYVEDVEEFAWNESITITHMADPSNKRYVEAWVTYYPTSGFSPILHEGTNVVTASDMFMKIPRLYPDVIQSITLPSGCSTTAFLNTVASKIRLEDSGNTFIIWGDDRALIYEWNAGNTEYDLAYDFNDTDCSVVYGAATKNGKCVISYYDTNTTSERLAYVEKSGTWSLSNKYSNPDSNYNAPINLVEKSSIFYIMIGGNKPYATTYKYSDRSTYFEADVDGTNPTTWVLCNFPDIPYDLYGDESFGYGTQTWSVGGGAPFQSVSVTEYKYNFAYATRYWPPAPLENEDGDSRKYGRMCMWQKYTEVSFVFYNDYGKQLVNYDLIDPETYESVREFFYTADAEYTYLVGEYAVGFWLGSEVGVWWVYKSDEIVKLEDVLHATHNIYAGIFHPIKSPYFLTNNEDGTLKLLEITEHYTDLIGTCVLKVATTKAITTTTDFEFPTEPTNTTTKFRLSWDNITFYK